MTDTWFNRYPVAFFLAFVAIKLALWGYKHSAEVHAWLDHLIR